MKNILFLITALLLLPSCSLLKKSEAHEKIYATLNRDGYNLPIQSLKEKLGHHLEEVKFSGKLVILNQSSTRMGEAQEKVKEALEDGFFYKDKMYQTTPEIGMDLLTFDLGALKDKVTKNTYHILEDKKDYFLMNKGDLVYIAKSKDKDHTTLEIYQIQQLVKPLKLNFEWQNLLKKKGSLFSITESAPDLELSMKYKSRDRATELATYFAISPDEAQALEDQYLN